MIVGIVGMIMLLFAWGVETKKTLENRMSQVPRKFASMYAVASGLLTVHAVMLGDIIFKAITPNCFAVGVTGTRPCPRAEPKPATGVGDGPVNLPALARVPTI